MNRKDAGLAREGRQKRSADHGFIGTFAKSFARTEELREVLHAALPEIFVVWAGQSRIKRFLAGLVGRIIARGFVSGGGSAGSPVMETCGNPEFLRQAAGDMPALINGVIASMAALTKCLSEMPAEESRENLRAIIAGTDLGGIGEIITSLIKSANGHRGEPDFLAEALRPKVGSLIAGIDFGEIKEAVDGSAEGITALAGMINEEMWRYPAKMVCLLSLIPTLANIAVRATVKTIEPLNSLAPDLLADVVISLVRDIDGKSVGRLVNELCEVARKVHTGGALIGDRGSHAVPVALSRLASETLGAVDVPLLLKSREMIRELGDHMRVSIMTMLESNPAIAGDFFQGHFRSLVARVRLWSLKADTFERAFSDEDVARDFARGMGELDAQEMAATLGRMCGLFNQVRRLSPGTIRNFLSQFFNSLDGPEVAGTAQWFVDDLVRSMKPIAPEIMPPVINGIVGLIAPDGEMSREMKNACDRLRIVFDTREVSA